MIYLDDVPGICTVGHEVISEGLVEIRVDYARQTLRGDRRTLGILRHMRGVEPEPGDEEWREAMDRLHATAARRPLVS